MVSFSQLPTEIWLMILESLPPSFFQQDIRRLALSRQWYALAYPSFSRRIEFTPRVIHRLARRESPALDRSRALLRKSLRGVNIVVDGLPRPALPGREQGRRLAESMPEEEGEETAEAATTTKTRPRRRASTPPPT